MSAYSTRSWGLMLSAILASSPAYADEVIEQRVSESAERHLWSDEPFKQWTHDPELLGRQLGDRIEVREVPAEEAKTIKLRNVVPPIRFESGVARIPPSYITRLRDVLDGMRHLDNVRLHLVGHADDQRLSESLAGVYGDNLGLSRERAGEVAEFIQSALELSPEAISFEWAGDTRPIASNATEEGRALNRRVEVEVWYDEIESATALEEVVVPEDFKRVKVCRMETVCKLRYREGHEHRARVKNLIAPLRFGDETVGVPESFVQQVREALQNLRDRRNVVVRFIGFTDDAPLAGREARIYGDHVALSKARARRVALEIKDSLDLETWQVASDGRGSARPAAPNETERSRGLNRRVEVEFWYDDPLQELPDEPQPCPDAPDAEVVTRVYEPSWGKLAAIPIEGGQPVIPSGLAAQLGRAMQDIADKDNVRLRFVGYTGNARLDRRTAMVYGDDVGLSTARARRTMETLQTRLELSDSQVEHEGHGYIHADDVVNAGFVQGDRSYVVAQVVYDELAILAENDGIDVTPITRELAPTNPLGLNLMRITVDGTPIDDSARSSADIQRCTDVALEEADIRFQFDNLRSDRRLGVASQPSTLEWPREADAETPTVLFRTYSNYWAFISRLEVRIFQSEASTRSEPLDRIDVDPDGSAEWRPEHDRFRPPVQLKYVLRAYDEEGRFDETAPKALQIVRGIESGGANAAAPVPPMAAFDGAYAGDPLAVQNILLGSGTVTVRGRGVPPEHTVWFAGKPVRVDEHGQFRAEAVLPSGMHTVEVAVLDPAGNGDLYLRDLELKRSDWFYVGMADLTLSSNSSSGALDSLRGANPTYDPDSSADGRLAFYVKGEFAETWKLTASADTREGPVEDLFTNFLDKRPESLFRRLDPDYYYPTFGDDSTVEQLSPTLGKFFMKLQNHGSHALWGNFDVAYLDNELGHVDRGLYGANLRYQSLSATSFGEQRLRIDGFAAEPGTVPSREEFRATGGSLYFVSQQDLLPGSERVRVEVRDQDSGLVTSVVHLTPGLDYDVDYIQGRILLSQPLSATVSGGSVVRTGGFIGDEAWLIVQYEYTPGFEELDRLASGGQGHYWFGDLVKLGFTASNGATGDGDGSLYAADLTLRKSAESWVKLQGGRQDGLQADWLRSDDGGFDFVGTSDLGLAEADASAYRVDARLGFTDLLPGARGYLSLYAQTLEAGYSSVGITAFKDTRQFGALLDLPLSDRLRLSGKADQRTETDGLETAAAEMALGYQLSEHWSLTSGVRTERREDGSSFVPVTQEEGARTDAAVQLGYDSRAPWSAYGFAQATLAATDTRESNSRVGMGGSFRFSNRLSLNAEASFGQLGPAARIGTTYEYGNGTSAYVNYALERERSDQGVEGTRGNLIVGARTRLTDTTSAYLENRHQRTDLTNGLTHTAGITLTPSDRWKLGGTMDMGTLRDRETGAETERRAGSVQLGYGSDKLQISSAAEYRLDDTEQLDGSWTERKTYLLRNDLKLQMSPDWRLVGKFNHSFSDSSLGQFFDGGYTEGVVGFAYRPVRHDRVNLLAKYTYFYNVPAVDPFTLGDGSTRFTQKSHVASFDVMYELTPYLSIGAKYAYRLGEVSLDREDPQFFANDAHLYIFRTQWRLLENWEGTLEMRTLELPDLNDRHSGWLLALYRQVGKNAKIGIGYNFSDFSEDLTDLEYESHGFFINFLIGM